MPRRSQQERTGTTRAALIASARELFATDGYAQVSAAQIVTASGLTRGAMYHHFADKQALFAAVFEQLETEITAELAEVADAAPDLLTAVVASLARFLDICQRPEVISIGLTDAPAVLGWEAWREIESRHGLGLLVAILERADGQGLTLGAPVPVLAQIVLSAVIEAALMIAHASDPEAARHDAQQALLLLLSSLITQPGGP